MLKTTFLKTVLTTTSIAVLLTGCNIEKTEAEKADRKNIAAQNDVKSRATASVPVPRNTNFQARKNLAEFMNRQDESGKIWYVYERAPMSGEILGVYTSSSYPQSVCTFMTPPEEVDERAGGHGRAMITKTAMALDGVYYKGGDCPDFFFDYTTDALIVLDSDAVTIAVDKPLDVDAPNFSFSSDKVE